VGLYSYINPKLAREDTGMSGNAPSARPWLQVLLPVLAGIALTIGGAALGTTYAHAQRLTALEVRVESLQGELNQRINQIEKTALERQGFIVKEMGDIKTDVKQLLSLALNRGGKKHD
jgi:hypothetical protein